MKLLYKAAEWHALAKLRMHSESTLETLSILTKDFGQLMRRFRDLSCSEFATVETPREAEARKRRALARANTIASEFLLDFLY